MKSMNTENNRTLVSKFVEDFNKLVNDVNKQALVKKHVSTHYAPILKKRNVLEITMNGCIGNGKAGQYIDMFASKLNFIGSILILYTDLTPDKIINDEGKEIPNIWGAYDLLKESGAYSMLLNEIGADLEELISVQEQILGTWHNENASAASYISNVVEKVSMILSTAIGKELGSITEVFNGLSAEEKQNFFATLKNNFKK